MSKQVKPPKLSDEVEVLDAMGKDSEVEAAKWVIEEGNRKTKEAKDQELTQKEILQKKRKFLAKPEKLDPYKQELLTLLKVAMVDNRDEVPKGYSWEAQVNPKGIVLGIKTPAGKVFCRGMMISGYDQFDHQGISRLVFSALDQMQIWENRKRSEGNRTKNGIYLLN